MYEFVPVRTRSYQRVNLGDGVFVTYRLVRVVSECKLTYRLVRVLTAVYPFVTACTHSDWYVRMTTDVSEGVSGVRVLIRLVVFVSGMDACLTVCTRAYRCVCFRKHVDAYVTMCTRAYRCLFIRTGVYAFVPVCTRYVTKCTCAYRKQFFI